MCGLHLAARCLVDGCTPCWVDPGGQVTCASIFAAKLLRFTLMPSGSLCLSSKRVRPSVATFWQIMLMAGILLSSRSLRTFSCKHNAWQHGWWMLWEHTHMQTYLHHQIVCIYTKPLRQTHAVPAHGMCPCSSFVFPGPTTHLGHHD